MRARDRAGCSLRGIGTDLPLWRTRCDRVVALELCGVIGEGTPTEVLEQPKVIESDLGTDDTAINRSGAAGKKKAAARKTKVSVS